MAGAFEGYCDAGYVWVPGSAKYGTLPGFCVMSDLAGVGGSTSSLEVEPPRVNVSQGEAQVACQTIGAGYHLIGENEWLTIAENILQVAANDIDATSSGMQLATSSSPLIGEAGVRFKLTNDNIINNLSGAVAEWTNQNVTSAGLPITPSADGWYEYNEVSDFKGMSLAPAYYLTDQNNNIGKIYIGSSPGLKGFVRGANGIYGLDLSHAPSEQSASIGFRCAK